MTTNADDNDPSTPGTASILCVDDEPNVLSSLRRLLRGAGYQVHAADNGPAGMQIMETETIDVVISDMRMPDMDGGQFLLQVRERWPETIRFLLTGEADVASVIEAVNQGAVSRYLTKPWNDDELVQAIRDTLERRAQQQEKARMAAIALSRTEELKALNASLQENVNASQEELTSVNERLKNNFVVSLKVISSLIEVRRAHLAGHARRVADLARKMATKLKLEPALAQEVFVAGLLHELGKLGFSDDLLNTPVAKMNARQLQDYRQHASRAEQLMMPLQDLRGAAASIGAQLERFDGEGFPNQLKGRAILVGARILAVCADYDNMQIGVLVPQKLSPGQARAVIQGSSGKRYDPWVVEAFVAVLTGDTSVSTPTSAVNPNELVVSAADLAVGMVLTRDLISPSGLMMLSANLEIDQRLIQKMVDFEKSAGISLTIYIKG